MKVCSVCFKSKDRSEFYAYKRSADKLTYDCKHCIKKRQKAYSERPEVIVREKEYKKDYHKRPEVVAKYKAYCRSDRGKTVRGQRLATPLGRAAYMLDAVKQRAKKKQRAFDLTIEDLLPQLEAGVCAMSGLSFDMSPTRNNVKRPWSPSVDQIDCRRGYVRGNIRVIVWVLNAALNSWGDEVLNTLVHALCKREHAETLGPVPAGTVAHEQFHPPND